MRNEKNNDRNQALPNDYSEPNQNKFHKLDGNISTTPQAISTSVTNINQINYSPSQRQHSYHYHHQFEHVNDRYNKANGNLNTANNNNNNSNGNINGFSSVALHPALFNIMSESQGIKFRGNYQSTSSCAKLKNTKLKLSHFRSFIFGYST